MPAYSSPALSADTSNDRYVYSVGTLTTEIRQLLEGGLPLIWLEGEISNFSSPNSGHWYFNLKDEQAQIQCAMFRNANRLVQFSPSNGQQVLVRGRITVYPPRGNYQLIIEHVEASGEGALRRRFEALKKELAQAGLFAEERKRALPTQPRRIGVITSPTGAAVRDIVHVCRLRYPNLPLIIYPAVVQGDQAAASIAQAIATANMRAECDVLIVGRGGGSMEDLWAFNEPEVAHALANSHIPTVSAVGHETDTTIADWVADARAATPSAAAERVTPDASQWLRQFVTLEKRLTQQVERLLLQQDQRVAQTKRRLLAQHPDRQLVNVRRQHQALQTRLTAAMQRQLAQQQQTLIVLTRQMQSTNPQQRLQQHQTALQQLRARLVKQQSFRIKQQQQRLQSAAKMLHAVSPLATLDRGYSITLNPKKQVLTDVAHTQVGDTVQVRLAKGELDCEVRQVRPAKPIP